MPNIPAKLELHLNAMKRAMEKKNQEEFNRAAVRAFEELEKVWPVLRDDIKNAE